MDAVAKANTMYNYHSVYWDVIDLIIKDIRLHKYKPGDRLPTELELMEQTGLSRSSVREAIKVLSAMGVVRIQRGSGTFISDASSVVGLESITYFIRALQGRIGCLSWWFSQPAKEKALFQNWGGIACRL